MKINQKETTVTSQLEFFVVLANHGSLAATARALDMTPPAVTKRLAQLEARLGVRLVNRSTRRLSLTHEGELLRDQSARILADIRNMETMISEQKGQVRGLLRINATLGFGRQRIALLASQFARQHPDIELDLHVSDRPLDLIEQHFDLGVRFGVLPDRRLVARRLMRNRRFLCASPAYLKRHGRPRTPADLLAHRCIIHNQNDEPHGVWRFHRGANSEVVKVRGALSSNDGDIARGWVLDGHGIMIRSEWDVNRYLDAGRLELVLPEYQLEPADLFVYFPSRANLPARVRLFVDFLAAQFR
ncbi:LysR family transcriptional regulator [Pigmentiphaga soli]|uniref:LysR family transcriptional regulator n=1 Tax=Pigmentiphaga soli TaxID=1007095 RepID=A0ABP8GFS0_9BURK